VALTPGTRIGSYEITAQIGVGGMGEVYRATDTNLARQVAIKVLPEAVASDAERLARFDREAKTLAALNHPNIAAIYGLERSNGQTALVMELVDGPTLADRIAQGLIPVDEALAIAKQIAEALEAAHELGIIHRDLKPANIKLRPDGTVKVLDFGLAKAMEPVGGMSPGLSQSPTITTPAMTQAGLILGTAAYMSPEQARGKAVDRRADIWAFGCVLFEMLTGRRAFEGEDVTDTLALVVRGEPAWDALPGTVPGHVRQTLRACLRKDGRQRMGDVQSLRLALDGAFETVAPPVAESSAPVSPRWRRPLPIAALALVVGGLVVGAAWALWPAAPPEVNRFADRLPDTYTLRRIGRPVLAVSPDGRHVALNTLDGIYLREMGTLQARLIPGTEPDLGGAFFSPDGQSIAYFDFGSGQLKRIGIGGGSPVSISDVDAQPSGAHWAPDDTIVFAQTDRILRVPAAGGEPEVVIEAGEGERFYGPQLLPDGDGILVTVTTSTGSTRWDEGQIIVASISTGERTVVVPGGTEGRVLPTGHLVYALGNDLLVVAFDVETRTRRGGPVSLVQGVRRAPQEATGAANYGVTEQGTLVYLTGEASGEDGRVLVWADQAGGVTRAVADSRSYGGARLSPDGEHLAVVENTAGADQVWIIELESGTREMLTDDDSVKANPVWTPDGTRVTFRAGEDILWRPADGSAPAEELWDGDGPGQPFDWSPDGQTLVFGRAGPDGRSDLWTYSREDDVATPFQVGPGAQRFGRFSPDGNWIAFSQADEGGPEVWVAPFPGPGTPRQVSSEDSGGDQIAWSPDGRRLYYVGFDAGSTGELFVSDIDLEGGFRRSVPEPLWDLERLFDFRDVHPDGTRFLLEMLPEVFSETGGTDAPLEIVFVQNWVEELKSKVPTD
jgi:serine/threonine-protein kinase